MDPPGSSDKAPADVKTAEWMVANKIAGSLAEAYALVSTSKSNPASFISRYVSAAQRNQDEFDPDKKSMRELTAEAREVYNEITGLNYGAAPLQPVKRRMLKLCKNSRLFRQIKNNCRLTEAPCSSRTVVTPGA